MQDDMKNNPANAVSVQRFLGDEINWQDTSQQSQNHRKSEHEKGNSRRETKARATRMPTIA